MQLVHDPNRMARTIIEKVGKKIVLGVPLGIGKPIGLINAFYRLAVEDSSLQLTIITGLTLARPVLHHALEKRFIEPILARLLKDYEDPLYEKAREQQQLPANINVIEFFLSPGKFLHNAYVQQHYISSKYTDVARDTVQNSINVIAQLVTRSETEPNCYSLSCNSDLFHDVVSQLKKSNKPYAIAGEINLNLPFMYGEAVVAAETFTDMLDPNTYRTLFATPREEVSVQDHCIGLYTSSLIKDDGCLQIGIGTLSNAIASALLLRQEDNALYQTVLQQLGIRDKFSAAQQIGETTPFSQGLYAATEMLSDEYMQLYAGGILKKRVYDHIGLQQLLNTKQIKETVSSDILEILIQHQIIHPTLTAEDIHFLQRFGILQGIQRFTQDEMILQSGEKISTDLSSKETLEKLVAQCLGKQLLHGKIIHAAFFLGSQMLYQQLNQLSYAEKQQIDMTSVAKTNSILWSPELAALQRRNGRFINSAMMVTLGGAIVSDGIHDLQEISGVGGQFDFVTMANQLSDARSIIICRSVRQQKALVESNIRWQYTNSTLPRYLRDVIVTEYGIADCRSKTDADVIKAILNVTDSRFQHTLLKKAKHEGKLAQDYAIPNCFQQNYPETLEPIIKNLRLNGYGKPYPFGSDLTEDEEKIKQVLLYLQNLSTLQMVWLVMKSWVIFRSSLNVTSILKRMGLDQPTHWQDHLYRRLFIFVLGTNC